ncbi:unnamed protein product [Adineta ricciae]|uniref:PKD/REJ-like domain-containing protein n=1 Tax=Adineta ricciae TaxID=249248 RepID=A0A815LP35_ADIRI|nr:unnamed protein product [Adineta ricciae]
MTIDHLLFVYLCIAVSIIHTSHFRGGTITWRAYNKTPSGSTAFIIVREQWSWRNSYFAPGCNAATIAAKSPMIGSSGNLACVISSCGYFPNMSLWTCCTDFSALADISTGEDSRILSIPLNVSFSIAQTGSNTWSPNLVSGSTGAVNVVSRISTVLRPDGYINSSPVTTVIPVIYKIINVQHVYVVPVVDYDLTDLIRCRWATSSLTNINGFSECGGVCNGVPGASLIENNCTIIFNLTMANTYAAVLLQVEDYFDSLSTVPMSSTPLQFLFYGYSPSSNCTSPPVIINGRPDRSCISALIGVSLTVNVTAQVSCPGKSIVEFFTSSPVGLQKSSILNVAINVYQINVNWIPTSNQSGPQVFCASAIDNTNVFSNQWCITFLVDSVAPVIIRPTPTPPVFIFRDQTLFSLQTTQKSYRPRRSGVNIYFNDANTSTIVRTIDCSRAPEVIYENTTIFINFTASPWISGHLYYVTMDSGVASGEDFCVRSLIQYFGHFMFWIQPRQLRQVPQALPAPRHLPVPPRLHQRLLPVLRAPRHPPVPQQVPHHPPVAPRHPQVLQQVPHHPPVVLHHHLVPPQVLPRPPVAPRHPPVPPQVLHHLLAVLRVPQRAKQQLLRVASCHVLFHDESLYVDSLIEFACNSSLSITAQWTITSCSLNCTNPIQLDSSIETTLTDLHIPERTLPYGTYELKLIITTLNFSSVTMISSVYVRMIQSEIEANLIEYGTSMITHARGENLELNPGRFSVNPDENTFNFTDWTYEYYCRIYGFSDFPSLNGSLLTIDDMRNDVSNASCLANRGNLLFNDSIKSSIVIRSNSLELNQTYQFMIRMRNHQNPSLQTTGYLLVTVDDTRPYTVLIGCVIRTICSREVEFQLVNPTTQVALFSVCNGNCMTLQQITWNVYYGERNSSSNVTQWILFNETSVWFFGQNTSNFTATNGLFLTHPQVALWRFETVYSSVNDTTSSSLIFRINQPPDNGFCSIDPLNGTINSIFTVSCSQWFDSDDIRDYALYVWTNNSEKIIVAFSSDSIFQVRLPAIDNQTSILRLSVHIRDRFYCTTEYFLTEVQVRTDSMVISNLISQLQNSSTEITTNPIVRLLASENQNIVGQVIISLSQDFNKVNKDLIGNVFSIKNNVCSTFPTNLTSLTGASIGTLLRQQHLVLKIEQQLAASALSLIDITNTNTKSTANVVAENRFMFLQ